MFEFLNVLVDHLVCPLIFNPNMPNNIVWKLNDLICDW